MVKDRGFLADDLLQVGDGVLGQDMDSEDPAIADIYIYIDDYPQLKGKPILGMMIFGVMSVE